ncbi:hypothetical protein UPYG_G00091390 [Umbra pygmaea]|uniref:Chemokine interleukin-8-like domain-containing protein n=1 Tax=Umbra pygmaea TaxID=75934 RepID=A0ABD0XFU5_UMBPY
MKNLTALLLLGLVCCFHMMHAAPLALENTDCCMKRLKIKIPLNLVASARKTSGTCFLKAIIFTTTKGNQFCLDPTQPWVRNYMTKLKNRSVAAKTTMM